MTKYKIVGVRLENEVAMTPAFVVAETDNEEWASTIAKLLNTWENALYAFSYWEEK